MAKILLVEDDNNLREIFELRLQADGYETVVASDGEEALVIALREKPDLIIADVMMPKMSGFEMIENLRAAPEMSNVKVVMMTALGQAEDRARGESLGVVKYLVKSQVTLEDFARVIKEVLSAVDSSTDENLESKTDNQQSKVQKEGDKKMPDDTTPLSTAATSGIDSTSAPTTNPISANSTTANDDQPQMTSADAQSAMQKQVDDFASSMNPATASSMATSDIPVAVPPDDPSPPNEPLPPTPPPSPDGPTVT